MRRTAIRPGGMAKLKNVLAFSAGIQPLTAVYRSPYALLLWSRGGLWPTFLAGVTYGFTPCAPLLMMVGYTFTLPVVIAGITGGAFGLASAASPILLLAALSGALSKRMKRELPHGLKWFQLASYLLLMVMPFVISI